MRTFVIKEQRFPTASGETPLSYGVFLETDETFEGLELWQPRNVEGVFICYAWSMEIALKAIKLLEQVL